MSIEFSCAECDRTIKVKDELAGRRVKCPGCATAITVPVSEEEEAPSPKKKPAAKRRDEEEDERPARKKAAARDEDGDEDRPRKKAARRDEDDEDDRPRKRRRDEEEDDRPRRKKKAAPAKSSLPLILAIVGGVVLLAGVGVGVWWMTSGTGKTGGPNAGGGKDGGKDSGKGGGAEDDQPELDPTEVQGFQGGQARSFSEWRQRVLAKAHVEHVNARGGMPNDILDPSGKPLLSWRVKVLEFMGAEQRELFKQFKLDEPWDSPNNKRLLKKMPAPFAKTAVVRPGNRTSVMHVVGPGTVFPDTKASLKPGEFKNPIITVEATADVEWTKPGDIALSPGADPRPLCRVMEGCFVGGFAKGYGNFINGKLSQASLLQLLQPQNDDTPPDAHWRE